MSDKEWIKQLKPGDKVFIWGYTEKEVATVDRITPTGRIVIGDRTFNNDGTIRGKEYFISLLQYDEQEAELIKKQKTEKMTINAAISLMGKRRRDNLPYEQAVKIIEILRGEQDED